MWCAPLQIFLFSCLLLSTLLTQAQAGQTPDGLSDQEWGNIQQQIVMSRYKAFEQEDGSYASANIANGWHIDYGSDGHTTLTPYKSEDSEYFIGLQLKSLGYANQSAYNQPQQITSDETRLTYQWDENVKEVWTNSSNRLEQWFEIQQRPQGARQDQQLTLQMVLTTDLQVVQNGNALNFANKISYDKLKVWDSTGAEIPAGMHLQNYILSLVVEDSLAVYPLTIDPSFQQQAYLKASNSDAGDTFGDSVAISGDTLVVGARNAPGGGAAYVFTYNGSDWSEQALLKASNAEGSDFFGVSVAISGDTIVVGAMLEDSSATGVNGNQADNSTDSAGAAYVFVRNAGVWSQEAYLKASDTTHALGGGDRFGSAVAISGDTVVVGAELEDSIATGVNGDDRDNSSTNPGAVYVFTRSGTTWSQQAYLKASNSSSQDRFGISVAISGGTVVVGAEGEDTTNRESGAVYVFTRSGTTWTEQQFLKASNTGFNDHFGNSVGVDGDTLVAGADQESSNSTGVNNDESNDLASQAGAAYVFTRSGTVWSQQAYLKASNTDSGDVFGTSVAISGNTVIVGAIGEDSITTGVNGDDTDNTALYAGAAYVFVRSGTVWSHQDYLKASNTDPDDRFGISVATSGETQVVGAWLEDSNASGIDGDQTDNLASAAGAVYVFSSTAVGPADQTITGFTATPSSGAVGESSTLSATASSGLPVTFGSDTPTICTVVGSTVSYLLVGTCTVTADQAGDASFNPAPQVTLDIGVGLLGQAITNFVATPSSGVVNGSSTLSATGGASGNPVVFGSSTLAICTVAGSTVTYVTAGTCTVTADQTGNASYNAAPTVALDITVTKADQTITGLAANIYPQRYCKLWPGCILWQQHSVCLCRYRKHSHLYNGRRLHGNCKSGR